MPRTKATGRRADPNHNPAERYQHLPCVDKLICWNCYTYVSTHGEQGWNPSQAGSVHHCRASNFVINQGSQSWFRHKAQSMVTLAQAFATRNEAPVEPIAPPPQPDRVDSPPPPPVHRQSHKSSSKLPMNSPRFASPPRGSTPQQIPPTAAVESEATCGLIAPTAFASSTTRPAFRQRRCLSA